LVLGRAANRKSRLGDHHAALSATAGGVAGSAAFQSIRLKLLRYQNVNAAAPGPRQPAGKGVGEGSLRELENIAGGFTQVTKNSALPEKKRHTKWLSMSGAAYPGARTVSWFGGALRERRTVDGRQGGKTHEKADRPALA